MELAPDSREFALEMEAPGSNAPALVIDGTPGRFRIRSSDQEPLLEKALDGTLWRSI